MKKIVTLALLLSVIIVQAQPGSLDSTFGNSGKVVNRFSNYNIISGIALQNDRKIVAAGYMNLLNHVCLILRYNADGSFDNSFATNGKLMFALGDSTGTLSGIALQQDGKIVVTGDAHLGGVRNQLILLRYKKNGTPDTSFGTIGLAYLKDPDGNMSSGSVIVQPDGKILVNGFFANRVANIDYIVVSRFLSTGKLDTSFNGSGKNYIPLGLYTLNGSIQLQKDGKIVGVGTGSVKTDSDYKGVALFRLNTNGRLDKSFATGGKIIVRVGKYSEGNELKILSNGKIVIAGITYNDDFFEHDQLLLRFNTNGFIDSSFGNNGVVITDFGKAENAAALDIQTNGKIVVGGSSYNYTSSLCTLTRYMPNGKPDKSFGANGTVFTSFNNYSSSGTEDLLIQPDGKILTSNSTGQNNNMYSALARYIGDATRPIAQQQNNSSLLLSSVKMFPNPVKDVLNIENLPASETKLTITNRAGNILKATLAASSNFYWKINDLTPGEYYLSIQNNDERKSFLFLKQ